MEDILSKKDRFRLAFNHLKNNGFIRTQKDLAVRMDSTQPNVSSALNGDEKVLTDNFLIRFNSSCNNIFNKHWLLTGEGEMLLSTPSSPVNRNTEAIPEISELIATVRKQADIIMSQQETINELAKRLARNPK